MAGFVHEHLFVLYEVPWQDAELLFEGLGKMTEIGKADLAAGLLNAALSGDQHFFCAL